MISLRRRQIVMAYTRTTWIDHPNLTTPMNATRLNNMEVGIVSVTATQTNIEGAWTTYTPSWTALGSAPSIGNGTLSGAYILIGKTLTARFSMVAGSTTAFGTSLWFFALPNSYVARAGAPAAVGSLYMADSSPSTGYAGIVRSDLVTPTVVGLVGATNHVTNAYPMTWAVSDEMHAEITLEIA